MRKYIRHPFNIPIEYRIDRESGGLMDNINNISVGGICFRTALAISPTTILLIRIPSIDAQFSCWGRVIWCHHIQECFEIGAEFIDQNDGFRVRLIEQICYIKSYQLDVLRNEGRLLSDTEAAGEWIGKYAGNFPTL